MQADQYNKAELARFEDELARKRADVEHDKHRSRQVELVAVSTSTSSLKLLQPLLLQP